MPIETKSIILVVIVGVWVLWVFMPRPTVPSPPAEPVTEFRDETGQVIATVVGEARMINNSTGIEYARFKKGE